MWNDMWVYEFIMRKALEVIPPPESADRDSDERNEEIGSQTSCE